MPTQELAKTLMGRKKRILHGKMMHGRKKKAQDAATLKAKRRKIEAATADA